MAGIRVPRSQASAFGVIDAGDDNKIDAFLEKPADPPGLADDPESSFASMGNYIFTTDALIDALDSDAENDELPARHGRRHHPQLRRAGRGARSTTSPPTRCPAATDRDRAYWRDVGTIDAYHEAHMDLVSVDPVFNLYNLDWPIWTYPVQMPGAKFTLDGRSAGLDRQPGLHRLRRVDRGLGARRPTSG